MTTPTAEPMTVNSDENPTPELILKRHFKADRARVFDALIQAEHLSQWFGPEGCTCQDAQSDPRVGGRYRLSAITPDCDSHTVVGEYLEVDAPTQLSMTWAWLQEDGEPGHQMKITITLVANDGGTDLTLHQVDFADEDLRDKHSFGWSSSFNKLERLLT